MAAKQAEKKISGNLVLRSTKLIFSHAGPTCDKICIFTVSIFEFCNVWVQYDIRLSFANTDDQTFGAYQVDISKKSTCRIRAAPKKYEKTSAYNS